MEDQSQSLSSDLADIASQKVGSVVGPVSLAPDARISTGLPGLDEILEGGFLPQNSYLVRGGPGTGKTILGMHFLAAGGPDGRSLYVSLGENVQQLRKNAEKLGIDVSSVTFLDLSPSPEAPKTGYRLVSAAEVEAGNVVEQIVTRAAEIRPQRIFLDFVKTLRLLSPDPYQYRMHMTSLIRYLGGLGATVLISSEYSAEQPGDDDLEFVTDGVMFLQDANINGMPERSLWVSKVRGSDYRGGLHSVRITSKGMSVTPRLRLEAAAHPISHELIPTGIIQLDALLHGGIERGSITLISGPTGSGKTTLGMQMMKEAASRGERSVLYSFEEEVESITQRAGAVSIPFQQMVDSGMLSLKKVEPLELSADEFAGVVRHEVERNQTQIVMLDGVIGYGLSIRGENLVSQLHALCKYLQRRGVAVLLINELESLGVIERVTDKHFSYLADNILLLKYWEERKPDGLLDMKKIILVLKKRLSSFERDPREIHVSPYGIEVSRPLPHLPCFFSRIDSVGK